MRASRIDFARLLDFFKKKLTVRGIIGHTQGVSSATRPPRKQAMMIYQSELLFSPLLLLLLLSQASTGAQRSPCSSANLPATESVAAAETESATIAVSVYASSLATVSSFSEFCKVPLNWKDSFVGAKQFLSLHAINSTEQSMK